MVVGDVVTTLNGNRVSMLCEVSGVPDPQVTWQKDGVEVQRGGKSFIIETASQSDSGSYMCIASNIAGKTNATSQLSVLGKYANNLTRRYLITVILPGK